MREWRRLDSVSLRTSTVSEGDVGNARMASAGFGERMSTVSEGDVGNARMGLAGFGERRTSKVTVFEAF